MLYLIQRWPNDTCTHNDNEWELVNTLTPPILTLFIEVNTKSNICTLPPIIYSQKITPFEQFPTFPVYRKTFVCVGSQPSLLLDCRLRQPGPSLYLDLIPGWVGGYIFILGNVIGGQWSQTRFIQQCPGSLVCRVSAARRLLDIVERRGSSILSWRPAHTARGRGCWASSPPPSV